MKVNRDRLKAVAEIRLECLDEDSDFHTSFQRDDGSPDEETNAWIESQLAAGNAWAWCIAHVTATYKGLSGDDYLGGCSYESEESFKNGGYYEDMVNVVVEEIAKQLEAITEDCSLWEHDQATCLFCVAGAAP